MGMNKMLVVACMAAVVSACSMDESQRPSSNRPAVTPSRQPKEVGEVVSAKTSEMGEMA